MAAPWVENPIGELLRSPYQDMKERAERAEEELRLLKEARMPPHPVPSTSHDVRRGERSDEVPL